MLPPTGPREARLGKGASCCQEAGSSPAGSWAECGLGVEPCLELVMHPESPGPARAVAVGPTEDTSLWSSPVLAQGTEAQAGLAGPHFCPSPVTLHQWVPGKRAWLASHLRNVCQMCYKPLKACKLGCKLPWGLGWPEDTLFRSSRSSLPIGREECPYRVPGGSVLGPGQLSLWRAPLLRGSCVFPSLAAWERLGALSGKGERGNRPEKAAVKA